MTEKLPWFAARLLFQAKVAGEDAIEPLFEERVVLIRSEAGQKSAERKARQIGQSLNHRYENPENASVEWTFSELLDLVQLNEAEIADGSEVYHHYLTADEAESIRRSLNAGSL